MSLADVCCSSPGCIEPAVRYCASCDRPRCLEHSSFSAYADEHFCNVDWEHGLKYHESRCAL